MGQSVSIHRTLLWMSLFFLLAALATYATFAAFVAGPDRRTTFYVAVSLVCAAELVLFAHMAHSRLARAGVPTASRAGRIQVNVLILVWLVLTIIAATVMANPAKADTIYSDRVLAVYLVLTFLFFLGVYGIYTRDIEISKVDRQLVAQRRILQLNVPDIEQVMRAVEELGRQHADQAVLADRVRKRVDTVRSALEGLLVGAHALDSEQGAEVENCDSQIIQQVTQLIGLPGGASKTAGDQVAKILSEIASR